MCYINVALARNHEWDFRHGLANPGVPLRSDGPQLQANSQQRYSHAARASALRNGRDQKVRYSPAPAPACIVRNSRFCSTDRSTACIALARSANEPKYLKPPEASPRRVASKAFHCSVLITCPRWRSSSLNAQTYSEVFHERLRVSWSSTSLGTVPFDKCCR